MSGNTHTHTHLHSVNGIMEERGRQTNKVWELLFWEVGEMGEADSVSVVYPPTHM